MSDRQRPSFISELKRREVVRTVAVYLGSAYFALKAAAVLVETFQLPPWVLTLVGVCAGLGIPVTIVLAWAFDITPHGIERTEPVDETTPQPVELAWLSPRTIVAVVALVAIGGVGGWLLRAPTVDPPSSPAGPSIAVLPLENLSSDEENRYFADGIHEELLTHLSKLGDLKVIARSSVMGYRELPRDLKRIAEELDVGNIMEGTVRRAGDRVRISVQLIDPASSEQLWAETYDRTFADIFDIQVDIAGTVTQALLAHLGPQPKRITAPPTQSLEAYQAFLRGAALRAGLLQRMTIQDTVIARATAAFEEAVTLDPDYALAHARLAELLLFSASWEEGVDEDAQVTRAREAALRALELGPDLPEAHSAMGLVEHVYGSQETAYRHLLLAREKDPNNAEVHALLVKVQEASKRWSEAYASARRAVELDPRSAFSHSVYADLALRHRDLDEAERSLRLALSLVDEGSAYSRGVLVTDLVQVHLSRGDLSAGREILRDAWAEGAIDSHGMTVSLWSDPVLMSGGEFREFIDGLSPGESASEDTETQVELRGWWHWLSGDRDDARRQWGEAAAAFEEYHRRIETDASSGRPAVNRARLLALAGQVEAARTVLRRALEVDPEMGPSKARATVYAWLGEVEQAVADLEALLSRPEYVTLPRLELDPHFEPIRQSPEFRELARRFR